MVHRIRGRQRAEGPEPRDDIGGRPARAMASTNLVGHRGHHRPPVLAANASRTAAAAAPNPAAAIPGAYVLGAT